MPSQFAGKGNINCQLSWLVDSCRGIVVNAVSFSIDGTLEKLERGAARLVFEAAVIFSPTALQNFVSKVKHSVWVPEPNIWELQRQIWTRKKNDWSGSSFTRVQSVFLVPNLYVKSHPTHTLIILLNSKNPTICLGSMNSSLHPVCFQLSLPKFPTKPSAPTQWVTACHPEKIPHSRNGKRETTAERAFVRHKKDSTERERSENFFAALLISLFPSPRLQQFTYDWYISYSTREKNIKIIVNHAIQFLHPQYLPPSSRRQHSQRCDLLLQLRRTLKTPHPTNSRQLTLSPNPSFSPLATSHSFQTEKCPAPRHFPLPHPVTQCRMAMCNARKTILNPLSIWLIHPQQNQNPYCIRKCAGGSIYINCSKSYVRPPALSHPPPRFLFFFPFSFLSFIIWFLHSFILLPGDKNPPCPSYRSVNCIKKNPTPNEKFYLPTHPLPQSCSIFVNLQKLRKCLEYLDKHELTNCRLPARGFSADKIIPSRWANASADALMEAKLGWVEAEGAGRRRGGGSGKGGGQKGEGS